VFIAAIPMDWIILASFSTIYFAFRMSEVADNNLICIMAISETHIADDFRKTKMFHIAILIISARSAFSYGIIVVIKIQRVLKLIN
jgi:hypothetical protein